MLKFYEQQTGHLDAVWYSKEGFTVQGILTSVSGKYEKIKALSMFAPRYKYFLKISNQNFDKIANILVSVGDVNLLSVANNAEGSSGHPCCSAGATVYLLRLARLHYC
jgi:hypothetical protein